MIKVVKVSAAFLSCLFGGEHYLGPWQQEDVFLSCLFGGELKDVNPSRPTPFLSCLFGGEQQRSQYNFLIIKEHSLNRELPPYFLGQE